MSDTSGQTTNVMPGHIRAGSCKDNRSHGKPLDKNVKDLFLTVETNELLKKEIIEG